MGPQAVRTTALVNECWESGDPGSKWLGHLDQRAETLTHGCHPRETCRDMDVDNVCIQVPAFRVSVSHTHTHVCTHINSVTAERRRKFLWIFSSVAVAIFNLHQFYSLFFVLLWYYLKKPPHPSTPLIFAIFFYLFREHA